jgi:LysM repeat protein
MAVAENPAPKPVEAVPDVPVPAEETSTSSLLEPANIPVEPPPEQLHTVVKGDTLTKIARKYQVSIDTIKKANGLKSDVARLGQKLRIPGALAPAAKPEIEVAPPPPAGPLVHTVAKGDTIERIARKYHVEPREIMQANDMKSDTVRLGRKLKIPTPTPR